MNAKRHKILLKTEVKGKNMKYNLNGTQRTPSKKDKKLQTDAK